MYPGSPVANAGGAGVTTAPPVPPQWPARHNGYSPDMVPAPPAPPVQQPQQGQPQGQQPQQGYGQPPATYNQQPQGAPAPQVPQRVELAPNHVLDGPGVPAELRGRTVDQVMRIYGTLADAYLKRLPTPGQQTPQTPAPAGTYGGPAPVAPPQGAPQPRNTAGQFQQPNQGWGESQPDVRSIIREELAPYTQNAAVTAMENARRSIPDFNELEGEVLQQLEGMPAQVLANPQAWVRAADLVRGQRMRQRFSAHGQPGGNTGGHSPAPTPPTQYAPAGGLSVPANSYGMPIHGFFTEGPTPPVMGQEYGLSAAEQAAAAAFNMSPEDYRAWKGGVARR